MATKQQVEEQQKYIRHHVPNPKRETTVVAPISHEEYLKAHFIRCTSISGKHQGHFQMKCVHSRFTDEVDIERTYLILKEDDYRILKVDEEKAKAKRKEKAEKEAKDARKEDKEKKSSSSCSICTSICDCIIDCIPGLRCLVDCCC